MSDTRSETYQADSSRREAMQQELMDLGAWLTEHPEARKNLKPIRGSVVLDPGVYYNTGTGMVERLYTPQHVALGARWFRIKRPGGPGGGDPAQSTRREVAKVATGFLTDTTVCIGCKACEVACKQWNQIPADGYELTGDSYDNTKQLSGTTWRHVAFIENPKKRRLTGDVDLVALAEDVREQLPGGAELDALGRWSFMSDVCKHCVEAPCQQSCPTGAIIRNEFDNVYIQPDVCNGCGYCVPACPYGVITQVPDDGRVFKCTLCYDRQRDGLEPACAKACPTNSIMFGEVEELERVAEERVATLHARGYTEAFIYGTPEVGGTGGIGGNHSKFILLDDPETYNLASHPFMPQAKVKGALVTSAIAAGVLSAVVALAFRD